MLAIGANDFNPDFFSYPSSAYPTRSTMPPGQRHKSAIMSRKPSPTSRPRWQPLVTTGVDTVMFNVLDYGKTPAVYNNFLYTTGSKHDGCRL